MSSYTVNIWGDSILRGVVFDENKKRYKFIDMSAVNIFKSNYPIQINNYSKFGSTLSRAFPKINESIDQNQEGNLILFEFGGNDCDYNWLDVSMSPSAPHRPNTPYKTFEYMLSHIAQKVLNAGKQPVFMTLPPIDADRYFEFICISDKIRPDKILSFLGEKKTIYRQQERYSNVIAKIAHSLNVHLVDVRDAFLEQRNLSNYLCVDGIHPNERGQKLIADVFSSKYKNFYLNTENKTD